MGILADTAVVIPHWGKPEAARVALENLRQAYPDPAEPQVVLVENGPPPVAAEAFNVAVVRLPSNRGFGAGGNAGWRAARALGAQFLVLLNNDVTVSPGIFEAMRREAERPGVGLIGAVLQEAEGLVFGGGHVSWGTLRSHLHREAGQERALHYIHGACLGITRACLEVIGELREDFFLYWEDVDIGLRARAAGFRFAVAEHPHVAHAASTSLGEGTPEKTYYLVRNALAVVRERGPLPARLWARLILPVRIRLARARGKRVVVRALEDARRGVTGPAPADIGVRPDFWDSQNQKNQV